MRLHETAVPIRFANGHAPGLHLPDDARDLDDRHLIRSALALRRLVIAVNRSLHMHTGFREHLANVIMRNRAVAVLHRVLNVKGARNVMLCRQKLTDILEFHKSSYGWVFIHGLLFRPCL
ncbi:hypothetical protein PSAC2689_70221 [Paraburkholderia sacchari]